MQNIICFVSDFGLEDTWVGVCHAVIHNACPQARIVDLGHQISPFDIRKAAAVACSGVYQLPDAIHLVVVDPGVGGGRMDLCLVTAGGARLVGPDNGVLIPAARRSGGIEHAVAIDPDKIDFKPPLPTFHARDVMAPAAAALACGVDPGSLGEAVDPDALVAPPFGPPRIEGEHVVAEVVDIDRFGSVRVGVDDTELAKYGLEADRLEMAFGHAVVEVDMGSTFSDTVEGGPIALVDSSGWLTLAVRNGSAAERFGIEAGARAHIRPL
jgi:S-adenosylmethionine hydrolase